MVHIEHVKYLRFSICAHQDGLPSISGVVKNTCNITHTTGKYGKIIFRVVKKIGALPTIVGMGESGQKSA